MSEEDSSLKPSVVFEPDNQTQKKYESLLLLRKYFYFCFSVWLFLSFLIFINYQLILDFFVNYFSSNFDTVQVVSLEVTKPFTLLLSGSFFLSFVLVLPIVLFYFWRFVIPGLYPHEVQVLKLHLVLTLASVVLFQFFSLFVVAPTALSFFLHFNQLYLGNMVDIISLTSFVLSIQKGFFICSLLPAVLSLLLRFRLLSLYTVEKSRRWFYLASFVIAMFLTPPDVISQCLMAMPLIFLFEGTIFILKYVF